MNVLELKRGDVVIALKDLDPKGANVRAGDIGVVFEEANYYEFNSGPMVRWTSYDEFFGYVGGGVCNVYEGWVKKI